MTKILFVCLGNICRSPIAEAVLKDKIRKRGLEGKFLVESKATSDEEIGNPVYPPAARELERRGLGAFRHRAEQVKKSDYAAFDLIICMDHGNLAFLRRLFNGDPLGKVHLLGEYSSHGEIADPWYTGKFAECFDEIERGCEALLDVL